MDRRAFVNAWAGDTLRPRQSGIRFRWRTRNVTLLPSAVLNYGSPPASSANYCDCSLAPWFLFAFVVLFIFRAYSRLVAGAQISAASFTPSSPFHLSITSQRCRDGMVVCAAFGGGKKNNKKKQGLGTRADDSSIKVGAPRTGVTRDKASV